MIPQIAKALSSGFTAKQVIDYILKKYPQHADKIKSALAAGFGVDHVLKYIGGGQKEVNQSEPTTEFGKTRSREITASQGRTNKALAAGAIAVSPLASQVVGGAISRALPQSLAALIPGGPSGNSQQSPAQQQMQVQQPPIQQQQAPIDIASSQQPPNVNQPNIAQPTPIPQVEEKNIQPPQEILDIQKKEKDIDNLWKAAHGDRGATLPENKELLRYSRSLLKSGDIRDYDSFKEFAKWWDATDGVKRNNPRAEFEKFRVQTQGMYPEKEAQQPNQAKEEVTQPETTISKGVSVGTPQGMGEVKELRNGKALININGKNHQVNENELIQSPLPEKEMGDLFDDLISGIEKQTGRKVSRNVEWAGYDPKNNELAYKPFGGDALWSYDNISPEDVEELTNLMTQRKSTGGNFIGTWEAGSTSPMGAAMYKLITKLQKERGGKGNEYKNKFLTFYDALEPAKIDAKRKHAERNKKAKKPRINQTPLLSLELQEEE